MAYRSAREMRGYVRIRLFSGDALDVALESKGSLDLALATRDGSPPPLWHGIDTFGDPVTVRIDRIESVGVASPEAVAAWMEEQDERKDFDLLTGDA